MWYVNDDDCEKIDFSKPIFAKNNVSDNFVLLLPIHGEGSYKIIGYDWFDFNNGCWNSTRCWKTAQDAIYYYKKLDYEIYNDKLKIGKS